MQIAPSSRVVATQRQWIGAATCIEANSLPISNQLGAIPGMLTGERNRTFGVVCQVLQRLSTQQDAAGWRVGCGAAARCMVELEACATRTPPPGRAAAACAAPPHRSHRPVNLKNMLRQIQPDRRNLAHGWLPLCRTKQPASGHVWMAPLCKRSCGAWSRGSLAVMCPASHEGVAFKLFFSCGSFKA